MLKKLLPKKEKSCALKIIARGLDVQSKDGGGMHIEGCPRPPYGPHL